MVRCRLKRLLSLPAFCCGLCCCHMLAAKHARAAAIYSTLGSSPLRSGLPAELSSRAAPASHQPISSSCWSHVPRCQRTLGLAFGLQPRSSIGTPRAASPAHYSVSCFQVFVVKVTCHLGIKSKATFLRRLHAGCKSSAVVNGLRALPLTPTSHHARPCVQPPTRYDAESMRASSSVNEHDDKSDHGN